MKHAEGNYPILGIIGRGERDYRILFFPASKSKTRNHKVDEHSPDLHRMEFAWRIAGRNNAAQTVAPERSLSGTNTMAKAHPREGMKDTIESIVIALVLAFVFRAF